MSNKKELKPLNILDTIYQTTYTKKFEQRKKWKALNLKQIISFIPGTIQNILVKPGQKLKKGDKLLILESMKMQNIIRIPVDGVIKSIHVKLEQKIAKNTLMVELE
jgi:biotin carboxyl carrier protein